MPKNAPSRNDPCPCGSGKKYKKCCLAKEKVSRGPAPPPISSDSASVWDRLSVAERGQIAEEVQELDDLSNGALDEIKAGRYDKAEKLCQELLRTHPDVIDGHDRLGMLREAQGRFEEAADHYAKVLAIIEEHPEDYGSELTDTFRRQGEEALAKSKPRS